MTDFYFDSAPESLIIIDIDSTILKSNIKSKKFFGNNFNEMNKLCDTHFHNSSGEDIFNSENIAEYFEFDFENREVTYINQEGYLFYFLLSSERIKIDGKQCFFISFKNVTDFVSYKNIFEELYNSLSTKTIELDNVLLEKERANKLLKQKDNEMLRQLILARDVQRGLFPEFNKVVSNYEIATKIQPATMISGDMVLFNEYENNIDIIIADVTGHGIPAALVTMLIKMSLQTADNMIKNPIDILEKLNTDMHNILSNSAIFVTVMYARMEISTGNISIINCGHPAPIIVNDNGIIEKKTVGGMMLGVVANLDYSQMEIKLKNNEIALFITDGLTEASDTNEVFFEDKLLTSIKTNRHNKPGIIIENVMKDLYRHIGSNDLQDDVSLVCIKRN